MSKLDPDEQRVIDELFEQAQADMLPKMKSSGFVWVALDGHADLALALQLGLAILLEKPLLVIAMKNTLVPQRLRDLADAVMSIEDMEAPESREKVRQALETMLVKLGKKPV